jgi:hypothetical protein
MTRPTTSNTVSVFAGIECGHPTESGTLRSTTDFGAGKVAYTARCIRCRGRVECAPATATVDPVTYDIVSTKLDPPRRKVTVFAPLTPPEAEGLAIAGELADAVICDPYSDEDADEDEDQGDLV